MELSAFLGREVVDRRLLTVGGLTVCVLGRRRKSTPLPFLLRKLQVFG